MKNAEQGLVSVKVKLIPAGSLTEQVSVERADSCRAEWRFVRVLDCKLSILLRIRWCFVLMGRTWSSSRRNMKKKHKVAFSEHYNLHAV